jgi:nicotinate phosphoribosyltransferase
MWQAMFHKYTSANTKWRFKARKGNGFPKNGTSDTDFLLALNQSLDHLCTLGFLPEDLTYLRNLRTKNGTLLFKDDFLEYLRLFKYNREYIHVSVAVDGSLDIVLDGPWMAVTGLEVPVLAIVSELHSMTKFQGSTLPEGKSRLKEKISFLKTKDSMGKLAGFAFADFGTRRRYSFKWQNYVLAELVKELSLGVLVGTSNVYYARKYNLTPIGTMAHEFIQCFQQLGGRLVDSQKAALEAWVQEYRGELGIALTDTVGFDAFLRDFDLYFAKLFDGCRHDSGDPQIWCEKLIAHYRKMGIDPKTKTAVFSDGLDFELAYNLYYMFRDFIKVSFGIGTNLMNDMGCDAISIVLKVVMLNGAPVAKVSDSRGKGMCEDPEYESYVNKVFGIGG